MPDLSWNKRKWDGRYHWRTGGDEWSSAWGGPEAQWQYAVLPRISAFVPTGTILEIAPGFGRWTQFLKDLADELLLVDLSDRCIESCKQRFADQAHLRYHITDGRSLDMIADRQDSAWAAPNRVLRNPDFMREAEAIRELASAPDRAQPSIGGSRYEKFVHRAAPRSITQLPALR